MDATPQAYITRRLYGIHEERGRESVRHLLRFYAGHDRNHLRQIERIIGGS